MDKTQIINEIKFFLEGENSNQLKYLVNVEVDRDSNYAECIVNPPGKKKEMKKVQQQDE